MKTSIRYSSRPLRSAISRAMLASAAIIPAVVYAPSVLAQQSPGQQSPFTANEDALGQGFFDMCDRFFFPQSPTPAQFDLIDQCFTFFGGEGGGFSSVQHAKSVVNALGAFEFNSLRTQTLVFSESQFQTIRDRLAAHRRRGGQTTAGVNLRDSDVWANRDWQLGGGAAADGDLGGDRFGLWFRVNTGDGEKEVTAADAGFESEQLGGTIGVDYRFGSSLVAGATVGYGNAELDLARAGGGSTIDTDSLSLSLYGSAYFGAMYLDAIASYVSNDYDSSRRAQYVDGFGDTVNQVFVGTTEGNSLTAALSAGYDFAFGGFTLTPSVGYQYIDATVDAFRESQGNNPGSIGFGMNLAFDERDFKSSTGRLTVDASYAASFGWGVLLPHARVSYVREFEDGVDTFGVRFVNDTTPTATPAIVTQSDEIDESYLRLAVGLSAQFTGSVSGYLEYQRLEGFESIDFQDVTLGVRMQF